jgi:hypothetical protein
LPAKDPSSAECPRCSRALPPGAAKVCVYCGAELSAAAAPRSNPPGSRRGSRDPLIGETVAGRFKVEELIGQGGMGKVYRARHLALDRLVCLKMLKPALLEDPTVVGRFEREALAASRLNHPNSIQVLDFGRNEADGALYIVMEYVQGKDLRAILRDEWPVPEERLCHIMAQVLAALGEAHAHNVIHRDLKPENIMVEQRRNQPDSVKVLDFGIAKILDSNLPGLTRADVVCGTPQYMAPEQATGGKLDARCDLYAVGIMLYQLTTGQLPFDGPNTLDVLTRQVHEAPVPPRKRVASISQPMDALILRVLAKDPNRRPQSAEEFRQVLLAIGQGGPRSSSGIATPARGTHPSAMAVPRSYLLRNAVIAACAAAAVGGGAVALRFRRPSGQPGLAFSTPAATPRQRAAAQAEQLVQRAAQSESSSDSSAARDLLLEALAIDPDNAEAHYRLGGLFLKSQRERARVEYQAAKRLNPKKYGDVVDAILKNL